MIFNFTKPAITLLAIVVVTLSSIYFDNSTVQAQNNEPLTNEMRNLLKSDPFNVGLLLQSTADFSLQDDNFNGGNRFGLGATRLKINGNVDGGYNYHLQVDFRRTPGVFDASIGYRASEGFGIEAGLQKPDIGLDLKPGPGNTDFISRARLIGTILNTREVGVSASGQFEQFDYMVAVFNGTGRSLSNYDNFMYAAKGAFTIEQNNGGRFYIGANAAINGTEGEQVGSLGLFSQDDRLIYGAFVDYESDSWFGAAEVLMTTFESNQVAEDETITGAYITVGNNVTDKDQLLARWDHIGYNEVDFKSNLLILGWNHQATSVISFQVNALGQFDDGEEYFGLAGNFQYQF